MPCIIWRRTTPAIPRSSSTSVSGSPQDLLNDLGRGELHVLFLRRSTQESGSLHERILGEDALELIMTAATDPAPELDAVPIERLRGVPMCLLRSDDLWGYNDYLMKECRPQRL